MNSRALLLPGLVLAASLLAADSNPTADTGTPIDHALQTELLAIREADQSVRVKYNELAQKHGWNAPELVPAAEAMAKVDAANLPKITALLDERGWIGPELVGAEASGAIFLVIQHADLPVQKKYLPMMRAAVADGKLRPASLALLEDRIATREGRPQLYGSQLRGDAGGRMRVMPIADPEHVDERRAALGLPPMAEYVKHWNLTWDLAEHKRESAAATAAPVSAPAPK